MRSAVNVPRAARRAARGTLTAECADGPIRIVQPAWDHQVQRRSTTLAPGETARFTTPIHLRFARDGEEERAIDQDPTEWLMRHAPVSLTLSATLTFGELRVGPCTTRVVLPGHS